MRRVDAGARHVSDPGQHAFVSRPHRTLLVLSVPVMLSLIAEPLAGLVDLAFVQRLGAAPAAALGSATALLSAITWVFNFLSVGTQSEVAHDLGAGRPERAASAAALALVLALAIGVVVAALAWPLIPAASAGMSPDPLVRDGTRTYLRIRLLGMPALLLVFAASGALRGVQDMRGPMWIAAGMSALNVALDALLIFGAGPVPALGIAGAAWATAASQVLGAVAALGLLLRRIGWASPDWSRRRSMLVVGGDMFLRTAALNAFLILGTRVALQSGTGAGAAHQVLRQVWMLLAFLLDGFAASAQSLVGYFLGAGRVDLARRVAGTAFTQASVAGGVIALGLIAAEQGVAALLVAEGARAAFSSAWLACVLAQPLNAVSFVTDGIHWGSRDYSYLRNVMLLASLAGVAGLLWIDPEAPGALLRIWIVTAGWIAIRAALGALRVWPGIGRAPLAPPAG